MSTSLVGSARRIFPLAWPVFVGQVAVLGFGTIDTVLVARHSEVDLAALAVGGAAYVTVFIGLMGVIMAIAPIVGRLQGAGRLREAGLQMQQGIWLALTLSVLGSSLLAWPQPFLALARPAADVAAKVHAYLGALAFALPASLLFTVYRGFNTAVSRPKAVMALQLAGLAVKVPLSIALVGGYSPLGLPALGVAGCGIATAIVMWVQVLVALITLTYDRFYAPYELWTHGIGRPRQDLLSAQLKLGIPMGTSILIEVTGFTFMAIFISRLGATPVAGHQIAANLVGLLFMLPLGLANGTSTLVAQRIGAGDHEDACRLGWHGLRIGLMLAVFASMLVFTLRGSIVRLYAQDPVIIGAALPLLGWVALFHLGDAAQCVASFVLRAWHIATLPVVIYALALWGVGLGGGYALAFGAFDLPAARGARGFWMASTASLFIAASGLIALLAWVMTRKRDG
ncbi:MAG TPA: MATE family efflux transporter [Burkholderiaceae bacterium]|nr:MATE family efflux transporter [Burkholderiaceae bacterium]